ncbi:VOC family protein [Haloferax larsenii]|uniref:Glyoxalase/Bleomycin resistance protein/Dioxygenase superfamily protein n=1 Tax=Haloferax larsenii TaxID=302484 RepID=A0A1H7HTV7_HALLR|nr:VOC family protein [Haloferax larsenii]SEK53584.1 Glyoxalase/Bleomycin resistance protein/Dioxygenase superfamily protein [Haloferax larsenii]
MNTPEVFHLHYHVPDVDAAAAALSSFGITPAARFGSVEGESVALAPEEDEPSGFRLRLQTNRGGTADVTLTPGPKLAFDHFGVVVEDVSAVVERATARDWSVTENERRTFLVTPWGFRIELQSPDSDLVSELGDPNDCHFSEVSLGVPTEVRDRIDRTIRAVVGDVSNLCVVPGEASKPAVTGAHLAGKNVEEQQFEMRLLAE